MYGFLLLWLICQWYVDSIAVVYYDVNVDIDMPRSRSPT